MSAQILSVGTIVLNTIPNGPVSAEPKAAAVPALCKPLTFIATTLSCWARNTGSGRIRSSGEKPNGKGQVNELLPALREADRGYGDFSRINHDYPVRRVPVRQESPDNSVVKSVVMKWLLRR